MCGIAGIFNYRLRSEVSRRELFAMRERMATRGPDGAGEWTSTDRTAGLAHRRLAIIDPTEAGAQPMASDDGMLVVTFNGEIYNYRAIRSRLEGNGVRFRSQSDTEVLLALYQERGTDMVDELRGMFAFAIWDERKKGLFLARDHFGIKPLYYSDDGRTLRFASQVKALLAGGGIDTGPSAAGFVGFHLWGTVPEPYTLYRGISALQSGTALWVERGRSSVLKRYFSISHELANADPHLALDRTRMREELAAALKDSVRHHLVSDVPVGLFLSSGLDSATIAALGDESGAHELKSVTLGFNEYEGTPSDEVPLARLVAEHCGSPHVAEVIHKSDMETEVERIYEAMDQPSIDGVNMFFVSRAASRAGMKVALAGTGGDELFGGYPSYRQIPKSARLLAHVPMSRTLGKGFRVATGNWIGRFTSPKYAGLLEYGGSYGGLYLLRRGLFMPWELPRLMEPDMAREGWRQLQPVARLDRKVQRIESPYAKVAAMEMRMYLRNQLLRDADWAGMAWSVEIRVPLVDRALFSTVVPWMGTTAPPSKLDMAAAPARSLPEAVLNRAKTGFSIPVGSWLPKSFQTRGLRGWARMLLSKGEDELLPDKAIHQ